jgi:hypothetical protein
MEESTQSLPTKGKISLGYAKNTAISTNFFRKD